jgi:predicted RNA-binding protein
MHFSVNLLGTLFGHYQIIGVQTQDPDKIDSYAYLGVDVLKLKSRRYEANNNKGRYLIQATAAPVLTFVVLQMLTKNNRA